MNVNRDLEIDGPAIKHLRTVFEDKTTHEKFINALDEKLPRYIPMRNCTRYCEHFTFVVFNRKRW